MNPDEPRATPDGADAQHAAMMPGEEAADERSSPGRNLAAALVIAVLSLVAMFLATRLQTMNRISTSPGLLPFITGFTLLLMAVGLGVQAIRAGGTAQRMRDVGTQVWQALCTEESRRVFFLIVIIVAYVVLVDRIAFDLRLPTPVFELRFSSYECFSILALSVILRRFWQATLWRCVLVSLVWIVALASVFRYGFHLLLPGSG